MNHAIETVVITGASAGVGRATVRALAGPGKCIGLLARGKAGLEAAAREVEAAGGKALVLPTDVADPDHGVQDFALARLGGLRVDDRAPL